MSENDIAKFEEAVHVPEPVEPADEDFSELIEIAAEEAEVLHGQD